MAFNKNADMFSYLPDSLIFIIISFLPFKEAARTCVLSKRWRYFWLSTKNIDFDVSFFAKREESSENKQVQTRVFIDFIRQWIHNYQEPIAHNFCLVFSNPENHLSDMKQCIQFAIDRKVKVLDLDFSDPSWNEENLDNHLVLLELNLHEEHEVVLESLRLFSCNFRSLGSMNFCALKSLSLGWIKLKSCLLKGVLSNCPLLENLSLKKCWDLEHIEISAPRLTSLIIDKCLNLEYLRVDANNLRVFKYSGGLIIFDIEYLSNMVEAVLEFGLELEFSESAGDILYGLLSDIWCVRSLAVCSYILQVIPSAEELYMKPRLSGVQHLRLKTALDVHEFYGISFFLNSCPCLQFLSIDLVPATIFQEYDWSLKFEDHEFLSSLPYKVLYGCMRRLQVVKVSGFKGSLNELMVLKYFINFGQALETMWIGISKERGPNGINMESNYRENSQVLLQFQKASPHLCISIC